jgi:hypothetical protein
MKRLVSHGVVMFAGLLASPTFTQTIPQNIANKEVIDPRVQRLIEFFEERACPVGKDAAEFIAASDAHELDWRLLPSIALVESGGGKAAPNNNILGWNSAKGKFPSVKAAIHTVASRFENSPLYRNKPTKEILRIYNNGHADYAARVMKVMRTIGPAEFPLLLN